MAFRRNNISLAMANEARILIMSRGSERFESRRSFPPLPTEKLSINNNDLPAVTNFIFVVSADDTEENSRTFPILPAGRI